MLKLLKNWTPLAMLLGAIGYPLFITFSFNSISYFCYAVAYFL